MPHRRSIGLSPAIIPLAVAVLAAPATAVTNGRSALTFAAITVISVAIGALLISRSFTSTARQRPPRADALRRTGSLDAAAPVGAPTIATADVASSVLARRTRELVDQQLAALDRLEADVDDPQVLDAYYHLDHLATRVRRSAESVLVLDGSSVDRARPEPVAIGDVIRAATAEVEDYRRVEPAAIDDVDVAGAAVGDIAHLLAELIDEAISSSPAGRSVAVSGAVAEGGYDVTVSHQGVTPDAETLAELTGRLDQAGAPSADTIGYAVVHRLADAHGIAVHFRAGADDTTEAAVSLPIAVFADDTPWQTGSIEELDDQLRDLLGDASDALSFPPPATPAAPAPAPAPAALAADDDDLGDAQQRIAASLARVTLPTELTEMARPTLDFTPIAGTATPSSPASTPASTQPSSSLPTRTPGAAAPQLDDADSRHIPDDVARPTSNTPLSEPQPEAPTSRWSSAVDALASSASSFEPLPKLVLPTRTPGSRAPSTTTVADEAPLATATPSDPDELRSKLSAFAAATHSNEEAH